MAQAKLYGMIARLVIVFCGGYYLYFIQRMGFPSFYEQWTTGPDFIEQMLHFVVVYS